MFTPISELALNLLLLLVSTRYLNSQVSYPGLSEPLPQCQKTVYLDYNATTPIFPEVRFFIYLNFPIFSFLTAIIEYNCGSLCRLPQKWSPFFTSILGTFLKIINLVISAQILQQDCLCTILKVFRRVVNLRFDQLSALAFQESVKWSCIWPTGKSAHSEAFFYTNAILSWAGTHSGKAPDRAASFFNF